MKNIYFVEVGFSFDDSVYLPYATGTIAAFLKENGAFESEYNLGGFLFRRKKIADALSEFKSPFIAAFSCSIWNYEYNKVLAKALKEKYPECIIIFGGHNISHENNILKTEKYIDILMYGEGEAVFLKLLNAIKTQKLCSCENISFRKNGAYITTQSIAPQPLEHNPSAYLSGVFDDILAKEPDTDFLAVLETNRGCPYSCAYCDWCAGKKLRQFPMKKILREIDWLAEHKIEYCFCADSNFGIFERDIEIAEYLAKTKKEKGFPKIFRPCYAKNNEDAVFRISSILNAAGMDKGATLAYQTLSPEALSNINRKNLTLEHFSGILKKYNANGIPTYSELILGLPGETRESFCRGICRLLESGQHNSLSVYHCEMLPNSIMSQKSYILRHKIKAVEISFNHMHSKKKQEEVAEYSHIIQQTATLTKADWIYCNLFSVCVQCFHSLGFLQKFAIYTAESGAGSYYAFYTSLLKYILDNNGLFIHQLFDGFYKKLKNSLGGDWNYENPVFGEITWTFEEGAYLELLNSFETAWAELTPFLLEHIPDDNVFQDLLLYQKSVLRRCGINREEIICDYDFQSYFAKILNGESAELQQKRCKYSFCADKDFSSPAEFAKEIVWYGRRRGDTQFSNRKNGKTKIITEYL